MSSFGEWEERMLFEADKKARVEAEKETQEYRILEISDELDRAYEYAHEEALRKAEFGPEDYPGGYDVAGTLS